MFHSNTELMIDYWRVKRLALALPRSAVDPAEIAGLLPQVFIAERTAEGGYRLRLAGQAIVDVHRGVRAGDDLLGLWRAEDRSRLRRILDLALRGASPLVLAAQARVDPSRLIALEIVFAPLTAAGRGADRFLGLYQPLDGGRRRPFMGGLRLCQALCAGSEIAPPPLRLAAVDGRLIA